MRTWEDGSAGKHEKLLEKLSVAIGTYSPTEEGHPGCPPRSRFSDRPWRREIRKQVIEQDTQGFPGLLTLMCTYTTHP